MEGLQPNAQYTVTVGPGIADVAGFTLDNPGSFTFQTVPVVDTTSPYVAVVDPAYNSTGVPTNVVVKLLFNKPVDPTTVNISTIQLYPEAVGTNNLIPGSVAVSADGLSATFTLAAPLEVETLYDLNVNGFADLKGQAFNFFTRFTTGLLAQTGPLMVLGVSPANGVVGVPVNAGVQVRVSAAVSPLTVGSGAIQVLAGGVPIAGTVSVVGGTNNTLLSFTPTSVLAVSTVYTVTVGGFTDLAGNAVQAFTSSFTTGSSGIADKGPFSVTAVNPVNGTTGVAVNTSVVVTFNEVVNPVTVNTQTMNLSVNGVVLAANYTVSGTTVTMAPLTALPGNATVNVGVGGGVTDLAGNGTNPGVNSTFTTANTVDTTPPTVVSVTPGNGATGIGFNGQVVITFSKSMNPSTLTASTGGYYNNILLLQGNGSRYQFPLRVSSDNRTVTLYNLGLSSSSVITVVVTHNVQDLSGNALADFQSQFTTATYFDTGHASVVSLRPGNGATGVPVTSNIVLYMNEALNPATVAGALHVSQNGQLVTGTVNPKDNEQVIEFVPSAPLAYGALVQVFLDTTALDTDGRSVNGYQSSFTTGSDPTMTAPWVVGASPVNGTSSWPLNVVIQVGYGEALNPATVTTSDVILQQSGNTIPATVSLDATGTVIQLMPSAALAPNTTYYYYVKSRVQGTNGLGAQTYSAYFTTGTSTQTTAPTVVAVSPPDQLGNVPVNANISVLFSGAIDPLTVNGATIQVSSGSQPIPCSISFSNGNQTVQLVPQEPLPASTVMTLTVAGVTDVAGNIVATHTTHFTTGTAPQTSTTAVMSANPPPSSSNIPLNVAISLQANAVIDPATVTTSTFQMQDAVTGPVAGNYSKSVDGMKVYFIPSAPLATGRIFYVSFENLGMTDLIGNLVTCCVSNFSFTTGVAASTTPPQVVGVSPGNGVTGVPGNAQIVILFNEQVDTQSLGQVTLSGGGGPVNVTPYPSNGNQMLTLVPVEALSANVQYTLNIGGVTDLSGVVPINPPVITTFYTGLGLDFSIPQVASVTPHTGTSNVPVNTTVQVQFNKPINVLTVTTSTFTITPSGGNPIAGKISVSLDGTSATFTSATFTPSSALTPLTTYSVQVTTSITDLVGQSLTFFQSTFTTSN